MSYNKHGSRRAILREQKRVQPEAVTASAIQLFLESLDCPRALSVWLMFKNHEHEQLCDLEFHPLFYNGVKDTGDAYAATKFLSKYEDLILVSNKDEMALQKFMKFEDLCKTTNLRFRALEKDPLYVGPIVWLHNAVIRKISSVLDPKELGEIPCSIGSILQEALELADWGPGASTSIKARDASAANKFQHEVGITRDCFTLFSPEIIENFYPLWSRSMSPNYPDLQVGNKVVTVPKDAKENRVIAVEPGCNMWVQKGIGEVIESRLRKVGIDLRYQRHNQNAAMKGSIDGTLATLDMSSASDSIAARLVEEILPPAWFAIMDASRSQYGLLPTGLRRWEKFSSMGNGFTFPLETLIFYAASSACIEYLGMKSRAFVYGDDVIIPTECVDIFSMLCEFYGFRINGKKSHFDSPFRESCGAHFYRGIDIKPIYLKGKLTTVPTVYRFANAVRRLSHKRCSFLACEKSFFQLFRLLVSSVPKSCRFWIPEGAGDGGFISNFDEACPTRARDGIEGYRFRHVTEVASGHEVVYDGLLIAHLKAESIQGVQVLDPLDDRAGLQRFISRTSDAPSGVSNVRMGLRRPGAVNDNFVYSHRKTSLRISRSLVPRWYDLGLWI